MGFPSGPEGWLPPAVWRKSFASFQRSASAAALRGARVLDAGAVLGHVEVIEDAKAHFPHAPGVLAELPDRCG